MRKYVVLALSLLTVMSFVGCMKDDDLGTKGEVADMTVDERIKAIEADPNLPDQAKAAQINMLRSRQQTGEGMSESMKKASEMKN